MSANAEKEETEKLENREKRNQSYQEYVKKVTPKHSVIKNCLKAFVTGGAICLLGQILLHMGNTLGLDEETAAGWCSVILVLLSIILTAAGWYQPLAKFGGAGTLVPISGFANSVAAPAIEFQKEGQVFGIGCKIFNIAGPVILYGIFTSWVLGVIYWLI